MFVNIFLAIHEPLHAPLKARQLIDKLRLENGNSEKGDQAYHRAYFEWDLRFVVVMQYIVVETILLVPQLQAICPQVIHRVCDKDEMLKELAGNVAIGGIFLRQLQGNGQHVQAVHAHPTGTIRLLEVAAIGDRKSTRLNSSH